MDDIKLGQEFGRALCKHFNMPPEQVADLRVHSGMDEFFGVSLTILLKPSDLSGIGVHMDHDTPSKQPAEVPAGRTTLSVAGGDTVIIAHPSMLTSDQRNQIAERAKKSLPQGVGVLVLDAGMSVAAVVKA